MFLDLFSSEKDIVQIVPLPECVAAIIRTPSGEKTWGDATKYGNIVYMALINEDGRHYMLPYVVTKTGEGFLDEAHEVQFRPAVHCRECGQKMWVSDFTESDLVPTNTRYECPCGATSEIHR